MLSANLKFSLPYTVCMHRTEKLLSSKCICTLRFVYSSASLVVCAEHVFFFFHWIVGCQKHKTINKQCIEMCMHLHKPYINCAFLIFRSLIKLFAQCLLFYAVICRTKHLYWSVGVCIYKNVSTLPVKNVAYFWVYAINVNTFKDIFLRQLHYFWMINSFGSSLGCNLMQL